MQNAAPNTSSESSTQNAADVSVQGLYKKYGGTTVLSDINLTVKAGEIFVLIGGSGSGKSVLLRHIAGLERASRGRVEINGIDTNSAEQNTRIAFVFQSGALFNSTNLYDNLAFYHREHRILSEKKLRKKINAMLELMDLEHSAKKLPSELSGGMRKRAAIARALIMEPQLILYDEPTSELDPIKASHISGIIAKLPKQFQVTSLVVSHDRDLAANIADSLALIDAGKLMHHAPNSEFRKNQHPLIQQFFNPNPIR